MTYRTFFHNIHQFKLNKDRNKRKEEEYLLKLYSKKGHSVMNFNVRLSVSNIELEYKNSSHHLIRPRLVVNY